MTVCELVGWGREGKEGVGREGMRGLCFCRTPRGEKEGKRNSACHDVDREAELDKASGGLGLGVRGWGLGPGGKRLQTTLTAAGKG